jgi:spermidine/putrescine-binding protein
MNWFQRNFKTIIYVAFLVPILAVAFVSISHVTTWYGLSNPLSWAIYLSIGIEIAALSALAAISAQMGKKVYFPFGIVTLIQFIGNIFFAYQYIDVTTAAFKDWVDLVDPIVSYLGVESGDPVGHKRFLALFSGGMLPIISLSFLHMLVKFEEEEKKNPTLPLTEIDIDKLSIEAGKQEAKYVEDKYVPTEEELKRLEEELIKMNEQKFGTLEGPIGADGLSDPDMGVEINDPEKKVLNYLRRDA